MSVGPDDSAAAGAAGSASVETVASIVERVWALESFGRSADALAEAERGLAQHPDEAELLGSLAWLEFFHRDRGRAEVAARQALAARPDDWRGLNILIELAVARGEFDEGAKFGRRFVAAYPDFPTAYLALAYTLAQPREGERKGRAARAARRERLLEVRSTVMEAVELNPERVETLRRGSILLALAEDDKTSADLLSRALALDPDNESLLMLVAGSKGTTEVEGLRLLSGVLSSNPQQRTAARELSDTVWVRARWLAVTPAWVLVCLMLFGYLAFEPGLSTTSRQRTQLVGAFAAAGGAWLYLFFSVRSALPKGYLRKMFGAVWWVWIGIVFSALAMMASTLLSLAFAVRGLPTQIENQGLYIGGLTMMVGFVAWLTLMAALALTFARSASELRNSLYPRDAEGYAAARQQWRSELPIQLGVIAVAVLLGLVPVLAEGIAKRPEAAGGFAVVAVMVGVPPLVALMLNVAVVLRARDGVGATPVRVLWIAAIVLAVAAIVGGWMLADRHAGQHDPPPTPREIKSQQITDKLKQERIEWEKRDANLQRMIEEQEKSFEEQMKSLDEIHKFNEELAQ